MIRMRKPDAAAIAAISDAVGVALPVIANTANGAHPRAIWMGPNEWMVARTKVIAAEIMPPPSARTTLIVDVGAGRFRILLEGGHATDLLAKGCSVNFNGRNFGVDHSAMTMLGQIPVVIDHVAAESFHLYFDTSFKAYVRSWFNDAVIEFGPATESSNSARGDVRSARQRVHGSVGDGGNTARV
jgi:sarcosine oxidase subunit gamma